MKEKSVWLVALLIFLTACNGKIESGHSPFLKSPNPVLPNDPVIAPVPDSIMIDSSDDVIGFGGGTKNGLIWNGSELILGPDGACDGSTTNCAATISNAAYSGSYTSRIFYSKQKDWKAVKWWSPNPVTKELPNTNEQQTDYSLMVDSNGALGDSELADGLVGLWRLNEGANPVQVLDSSASHNHGTTVGNVSFNQAGKLNTSANFDGTANITASPNNAPVGAQPRTTAAWIKMSNLTAVTDVIAYGANSTGALWEMCIWNGNMIFHGHGGGFDTSTVPAPITVGKWHHVALTYNNPRITVYLDGVEKGYINKVINTASGGFFNIAGPGYFAPLRGSIDEIGIWSRALNGEEIKKLYQRGNSRIKFQIRVCNLANCSDNPTWVGPDGSDSTYFTELHNNDLIDVSGNGVGEPNAMAPRMLFSRFSGVTMANSSYFQYRLIVEADAVGDILVPKVQKVEIEP